MGTFIRPWPWPACPSASSGRTRVVLEEEEECTRRCIGELHAAVLELMLQDFWEGGLQCAPPPPSVCCALPSGGVRAGAHRSPPVSLCTNPPPPPGRPPCAAPWGTVSSEGFREGGLCFPAPPSSVPAC